MIEKGPEVTFMDTKCYVIKRSYNQGGRVALQLVEQAMGDPFCTATVNLPDQPLEPGEVFIKNWSENEGLLEALIKAKIVEDTGKKVPTGHVEANVCKLLI